MLLKELEKIIRIVEKSEIAELEWEKNKERIRIRKTLDNPMTQLVTMAPAHAAPAPAPLASPAPTPAASHAAKSESQSRTKEVLSPFVGTFYASPAPGSPKYVDSGARVKKGDVLCIIEAMKIMNEIEAEFPGKIISVLAKDGQPVQYGQPLFQVEP